MGLLGNIYDNINNNHVVLNNHYEIRNWIRYGPCRRLPFRIDCERKTPNGKKLLNMEVGNNEITNLINSQKPFMCTKWGCVESSTVFDIVGNVEGVGVQRLVF